MTWSRQIFSPNLTAFSGGLSELSVGPGLPELGPGSSYLFLVIFAYSYCHPSQTGMRREAKVRGEN